MPKKINLNISVTELDSENELSEKEQELLRAARKATENAYAPYSNFLVGAAILLESGEIITGTNQENAAYPSGLCAERTAIYWAGANRPNQQIISIAVTARKAESNEFLPVSPCGGCRQAMLEYEHKQQKSINMILEGGNGKIVLVESIASLLPLSFTAKSLK
ncbi:cytidine deaminase [Flammeovirgaceae bacterium SG7u.111]|nr:cytidine deaminase [Flammeovirgaceae bacterium SG7u.132]WPO35209.1 cytidine deaminase [Flammeovirgaceae bacterium SG7u.111]